MSLPPYDLRLCCGLRVLAEGTGHGAKPVGSLADTVLLRTGALKTIDVDPATRSAWVGAGAEWGQVSAAAAAHGLVAQAGSAADVGVAGFLLSGGVSWLARSHGLAVNDILAVEMVDARGVVRVVDAATDPDLFWAIRGGGGGLGVVTRFRLRLHDGSDHRGRHLVLPDGTWRGGAPRLAALDAQCSGTDHELRTAAAVPTPAGAA